MTSKELYYEFMLLLNKNATNVNINVDEPNFVWLYNREAKRWLKSYIERSRLNSDSGYINELLITDKELSLLFKNDKTNVYELPLDFFDFVGSYSNTTRDDCESITYNYLQRPKDLQVAIDNSFTLPSFDYEESLVNLNEKKVTIHKLNYEIKATYLSYYKTTTDIDISGYQKTDGTYSEDIEDGLSPYLQSQIIDRIVTEVMREFENPNGYQVSIQRQTVNP